MRRIVITTTCLLTTTIGWTHSIPEAQPANGWLLALIASAGALLHSLNKLETTTEIN